MSVDPAVWRRDACELAGRNLTETEWNVYLPARDRGGAPVPSSPRAAPFVLVLAVG